jgi:hypothetical protein
LIPHSPAPNTQTQKKQKNSLERISNSDKMRLSSQKGTTMKTNQNQNLCKIISPLALCALLVFPTPNHAGEMQASDGDAYDNFGWSVSLSGTTGLVGARWDDIGTNTDQGSAYVFRNLNTATGTVNENAKLEASDGATGDGFGVHVSVSGTTGLVGASFHTIGANTGQGSAYVFRNLDTATGTVNENAKLVASVGAVNDEFGRAVSLSGTIGLVGAYLDDIGANFDQGSAYVFRDLDTATGTVNENAKLVASDGAANDEFGVSVSLSGTIGLVGAYYDDIGANNNQGSAYVFRDLDTATGTVNENAKLVASDGAVNDEFGRSVSLSGTIGLVGAYLDDIGANFDQGSAYVFRNLNTATGTITENAKLVASDGADYDEFGVSVSLSGTIGLVGAHYGDIGANTDQGSAYVFRNLDTATGTINESVKLFASNGAINDFFGFSVSLDGDRFVIGAYFRDIGINSDQGNAYFGHVRTFTTANLGSDATATDGLSFEARDNWIIGQTTSNNSVTLTSGDSGNVGRVGLVNPTTAQTYIGQNAGSNNNTLHVESGATLTSNSINVGASGNSGNQLRANGTINLSSGATLTIADANILSGAGTIQGTGSVVVINGSLRPGSGNLGSGIGTLTRNNGNVTWNGNASSPWVFELGMAQATLALANTGGTRDLLDITGGNFLKGTGSSFVFDFAGTGSPGWYKLVDWNGTTDFSVTDFSAININPLVASYSFHIDNGPGSTTALYINLSLIPEPQVWALLSALLGALVVIRQRLRKDARAQTTSAT